VECWRSSRGSIGVKQHVGRHPGEGDASSILVDASVLQVTAEAALRAKRELPLPCRGGGGAANLVALGPC